MKIAVTGASGFIGTHVVKHILASGYEVVALGRKPEMDTLQAFDPNTGLFYEDSLCSLCQLLTGVDVIFHLAARSSLDRSVNAKMGRGGVSSLTDYLGANVTLTESLLKAAVATGVRKFVFASSRMVYPSWLKGPKNEDMTHRPDSPYGLSKKIAEDLVQMYSDDKQLIGISLRLGQVMGEGDNGRGILPHFIKSARAGISPTVYGEGRSKRDFVDVRDVVRAFLLSAEKSIESQVFNISGGRGYSIKELAELVSVEASLDIGKIQYISIDNEDLSDFTLNCSRASGLLNWTPDWTMEKVVNERVNIPWQSRGVAI